MITQQKIEICISALREIYLRPRQRCMPSPLAPGEHPLSVSDSDIALEALAVVTPFKLYGEEIIDRLITALGIRYNFAEEDFENIDGGHWWVDVGPEIAEELFNSRSGEILLNWHPLIRQLSDRNYSGRLEDLADKIFAEELEKEKERQLERDRASGTQ